MLDPLTDHPVLAPDPALCRSVRFPGCNSQPNWEKPILSPIPGLTAEGGSAFDCYHIYLPVPERQRGVELIILVEKEKPVEELCNSDVHAAIILDGYLKEKKETRVVGRNQVLLNDDSLGRVLAKLRMMKRAGSNLRAHFREFDRKTGCRFAREVLSHSAVLNP